MNTSAITSKTMIDTKKGRGTIIDIIPFFKKNNENEEQKTKLTRADIVKNFSNLFDLIII